jgi:hypothetical protein
MSNQKQPTNESTAFERIGGKVVLIALAALSSGAGFVALLTGRLDERGLRSAPLSVSELNGLAAYAGGFFLIFVGITRAVFAFRRLRSQRVLKVLLAADTLTFVTAVVTRFPY